MADFTTVITSTSVLDENAVLAFDRGFIIENQQAQVLDDNIVMMKEEFMAKSLSFPRYGALTPTATPLTETEDVTSTAMSDTDITVTPKEFGDVITTTKLSNLQSGGRTDVGAAALVGRQAGRSQDLRCLNILATGSNVIGAGAYVPGGSPLTAGQGLLATDIADTEFFEKAYNQLARASIPAIGNDYVAVMHDDVISDIRTAAGAASWTDVNKYASDGSVGRVLKNEVGMFKGFRIVRQNDCQVTAAVGSPGPVSAYQSYFLGYNAVGKGTSLAPRLTITGPFDKLSRFLNIGWYGVYDYTLIEPNALVVGVSASSRQA